ncbi:hypothetical protein HY479_03080 [Candidatus Uhrbacteria bacterium]|nr:hypothetical protein [Candidatus Uhrbacteria bacterium]
MPTTGQRAPLQPTENKKTLLGNERNSYCTAEPEENEIGAMVYPISPAYWNMPHLGQIFTALDCNNRERAMNVPGMRDGTYVSGISLSWGDGAPTSEMAALLKKLGFTETKSGLWQKDDPISLDGLDQLRALLRDPEKNGGLESEDCLNCG